MRRWVLHVDMDAFFASVEQLTRPTIRDRPVLVGGSGPRGTVAGASYQAREYGARSAMPMAEARRLCPVAVILPPRFPVYQAVSKRVMAVVRAVSDRVEQVSIDEAFLEPSELAGADAAAVQEAAAGLRARVRHEVGVIASIGAGSGKQLAKIASGLAKPDGALVVAPEEEDELLSRLPVRKLWGIGPVTEGKLHRIGVHKIGELAALRTGDVTALLGQALGRELHRLAQGIDDHPVAERAESKQVSAETTVETDITDPSRLATEVVAMAESAHRRLLSAGRAARTITVKVRDAAFTTVSRAETLPAATRDLAAFTAVARRLAAGAVAPGTPIRLVGVSYSGLDDAEQAALFDNPVDPVEDEDDAPASAPPVPADNRQWRAGDDVRHPGLGHGWVQGAGHGRVTVRFETAATGPGTARTFAATDPDLRLADPLASLGW
jgi:DNA polymerase-4